MAKNINISTFNVTGIKSSASQDFIKDTLLAHNIDFMLLQETWLLDSEYGRGDRGSLGHGVQWDIAYIGNAKKENAIMTLSNKCQGNPPSFCFLSRRNLYSCKSGEKKLLF